MGRVLRSDGADRPGALEAIARHYAEQGGSRLHERVYGALRAAILSRELPPGTKIVEAAVLTTLNLSRTPLREAFRLLEAEGLVEYSPSRGVVVRGLQRSDFLDIYEFLEVAEAQAARLAATRISNELLSDLHEMTELMEFHSRHERWDAVSELGIRFHQLVYRASGNKRLQKTLMELRDFVYWARRATLEVPGRGLESVREHRLLYEAIAERDGELAAERAHVHVDNAGKTFLASFVEG